MSLVMEPIKTDKKVAQQLHTYEVEFNDKAITNLKYKEKTILTRKRIRVRLKNGPRGVVLRWTVRTNKKVFSLMFKFRKKILRHNRGEFTPGVLT